MSYKVDSIDIVFQQNFRLPIEHVDRLQAEIGDEHPESWLFDKPGNWQPAWEERDSYRYFNTLWWNGEGSGHPAAVPQVRNAADCSSSNNSVSGPFSEPLFHGSGGPTSRGSGRPVRGFRLSSLLSIHVDTNESRYFEIRELQVRILPASPFSARST